MKRSHVLVVVVLLMMKNVTEGKACSNQVYVCVSNFGRSYNFTSIPRTRAEM